MAAATRTAEFLSQQHRCHEFSPPSSPLNVGLCFSALVLRFLSAGSARVGGGAPIAWRAAAFTAEAARNGLGLRGLDGIKTSAGHQNN
jgi:hypothetical protein